MKYKLSILFIFFACLSIAQSAKENYANKLSARFKYVEAYPVWEELATKYVSKHKGNVNSLKMAADAAFKSEQFDKALNWNMVLVQNNWADTADWNQLFQLLLINNDKNKFKAFLDSAAYKFPKSSFTEKWKVLAFDWTILDTSQSDFEVALLRPKSKAEEFAAVPYKKGILFVSNEFNIGFVNQKYARSGQNYSNIFYVDDLRNVEKSIKKKQLWDEIKQIKAHDGPISFSRDGKKVFITRNQLATDDSNRIQVSKLEQVIFIKKGGDWVQEESFAWNSNKFSTGHAVIDTNKNIIFSSNKPGGYGGADLYLSEWQKDHYAEPINLGPTINTPQDELFPFVSSKGYLYFSSNGWPGLGGLDIFRTDRLESEPVNMERPLNSNADDFAFSINEEKGKGYISSNRNKWKDQIYKITRANMGIDFELNVSTCLGRPLINLPIIIKDKSNNRNRTVYTNEKGFVNMDLQIEHQYVFMYAGDNNIYKDSILFAAKAPGKFQKQLKLKFLNQVWVIKAQTNTGKVLEGVIVSMYQPKGLIKKALTDSLGVFAYMPKNKERIDSIAGSLINYEDAKVKNIVLVKDVCNDTVFFTLVFQEKKAEEFINLGMIFYDLDKSFLRPEGKVELDKLVVYMLSHPELTVELSSHTDSRESDEYNIKLSQRRSNSCVKYIIAKGIPKDKIVAKGYGETRLLNNCSNEVNCTDEEHQLNRRTELKILLTESQIEEQQ
jgi:outer membrane protein OmpA-like peptidoglycan-associated protein